MEYLQIEEIGKGGMGVVYKAFSPALDQWVVLKQIHPALTLDASYSRCLEEEAKILSALKHPNIVSFLGYDRVLSGPVAGPCLVMEYVEGWNLREWMKGHGPFSFEKAVPIFLELCGALKYLHSGGILHLDLKPENILIIAEGKVFVSDFGISSVKNTDRDTLPVREPAGSLEYMAPERLKGEKIDARSDLYSLGMVLYTLLCGKSYFDGLDQTVIWRKLVYDPCPFKVIFPGEVPLFFQTVIRKLIAKPANDRYPDIETVMKEFQSSFSGIPEVIQPRRFFKGLFLEKGLIPGAGLLLAAGLFFAGTENFNLKPADPAKKEQPLPEQKTGQKQAGKKEPVYPGIQLSSLKREKKIAAAGRRNPDPPPPLEDFKPALLPDEEELGKFLLNFKWETENRRLHALEEVIQFSPLRLSLLQKFLRDHSRVEVEFEQVSRGGDTISVQYRLTPFQNLSGNAQTGTLLFQEGKWISE